MKGIFFLAVLVSIISVLALLALEYQFKRECPICKQQSPVNQTKEETTVLEIFNVTIPVIELPILACNKSTGTLATGSFIRFEQFPVISLRDFIFKHKCPIQILRDQDFPYRYLRFPVTLKGNPYREHRKDILQVSLNMKLVRMEKAYIGSYGEIFTDNGILEGSGTPHWRVKPPNGHWKIQKFKKVMPIMIELGGQWQHFVQDTLDRIMYGYDILMADPEIKLMLFPLDPLPNLVQDLLPMLGIPWDRVIFGSWMYNQNENFQIYEVDEIYHIPKTPSQLQLGCGPMLRRARDLLVLSNQPRNLVLLVHRPPPKKRSLHPNSWNGILEEVEKWTRVQWSWAHIHIVTASGSEKVEETATLFARALAVIYVHGGAGYNLIFSRVDTIVLEMVPEKQEYIDLRFFIGNLGLTDYRVLLLSGASRDDANIHVPLNDFRDLLWLRGVQEGYKMS